MWTSVSYLVFAFLHDADKVPDGEVAVPVITAMLEALEARLMERLAAVVRSRGGSVVSGPQPWELAMPPDL